MNESFLGQVTAIFPCHDLESNAWKKEKEAKQNIVKIKK